MSNAEPSAPVVPVGGRFSGFSLWIEGLPDSADLNSLRASVGSRQAALTYIGVRQRDGWQQVSGLLPQNLDSGLQPVHLTWMGQPAALESYLRLTPPVPLVPRVMSITDGVCVGAGPVISSRSVRCTLEEALRPEDLSVTLNGRLLRRTSSLCTIPGIPRHEIHFRLPAKTPPGVYQLECRLGRRGLGTFPIVVCRAPSWWRRRIDPAELLLATRRLFRR
jgi:hypothetical protein